MPTVEELKQKIGRRTQVASVRDTLKEIPYFKSYSEEQLKVIIPDLEGDTKYTSNDIEQLLKKWLENEQKTVKNPKDGTNPSENVFPKKIAEVLSFSDKSKEKSQDKK